MQPITRNGIAPIRPKTTYCRGNKAADAKAKTATTVKLIHQGDRNRIANSEFLAIFNFTQHTPGCVRIRTVAVCTMGGEAHCLRDAVVPCMAKT
jgi:hypothetical protein